MGEEQSTQQEPQPQQDAPKEDPAPAPKEPVAPMGVSGQTARAGIGTLTPTVDPAVIAPVPPTPVVPPRPPPVRAPKPPPPPPPLVVSVGNQYKLGNHKVTVWRLKGEWAFVEDEKGKRIKVAASSLTRA